MKKEIFLCLFMFFNILNISAQKFEIDEFKKIVASKEFIELSELKSVIESKNDANIRDYLSSFKLDANFSFREVYPEIPKFTMNFSDFKKFLTDISGEEPILCKEKFIIKDLSGNLLGYIDGWTRWDKINFNDIPSNYASIDENTIKNCFKNTLERRMIIEPQERPENIDKDVYVKVNPENIKYYICNPQNKYDLVSYDETKVEKLFHDSFSILNFYMTFEFNNSEVTFFFWEDFFKSPLMMLIGTKNLNYVKMLSNIGKNIDKPIFYNSNTFEVAKLYGNQRILAFLLVKQAIEDPANKLFGSLLNSIIDSVNMSDLNERIFDAAISEIRDEKIDVNAIKGLYSAYDIFQKHNFYALRKLTDVGLDLEKKDDEKNTALMYALIEYDNTKQYSDRIYAENRLKSFLNYDYEIQNPTEYFTRPLIYAIELSNSSLVSLLLNKGASIEIVNNHWKEQTLFTSKYVKNTLKEAGANIKIKVVK